MTNMLNLKNYRQKPMNSLHLLDFLTKHVYAKN